MSHVSILVTFACHDFWLWKIWPLKYEQNELWLVGGHESAVELNCVKNVVKGFDLLKTDCQAVVMLTHVLPLY